MPYSLHLRVSIHARRVTGDYRNRSHHSGRPVSIHARRVTGDSALRNAGQDQNVSIHARRVTGDVGELRPLCDW